jgi:TolB-like protein/tetratricopeptide (TPR) repeat protein
MRSSGQDLLVFEGFTLDLSRGCLRDASGEIELRRKNFQFLHFLVENAGRLISKEELAEVLWPNVTVGDDSVVQCVSDLRHALGDSQRRIIKTLPRRGYLFAVPVSIQAHEVAVENCVALEPNSSVMEQADTSARAREDAFIGKAAFALPDKPSIAVLPFTNMSGDPEQEYFVDGMVEEIITALSRIRWLFVIARNSTFTYKGRAVDVKQVGHELGVRYVLEGSVRKAGNRVRITGQLIDTTSGAHIWSDRFDGALDDIFELQDQVAIGVVGVVEPRLRLAEIERANRKPTQSLDAYDLYLRAIGRFHAHSREGALEAVDLLKRALAIDPTYAPAAALIGACHLARMAQGWGPPISEAEIEEIVRLARQAIQCGKDDPDTLWMAALSLSHLAGEDATAAHLLDFALTLSPNSAHAWYAKGFVAYRQNQLERAIDAIKRAIRLSPLDPLGGYFSGGLALANLASGRYEEALEWAERSVHEFPEYAAAIRSKVVACVQLGLIEEARSEVRRLVELHPGSTIAKWQTTLIRFLPSEVVAVQVDSLRKAGMPEM